MALWGGFGFRVVYEQPDHQQEKYVEPQNHRGLQRLDSRRFVGSASALYHCGWRVDAGSMQSPVPIFMAIRLPDGVLFHGKFSHTVMEGVQPG